MENWKQHKETEEEKKVYPEKKSSMVLVDADGNPRRILEQVEEGDKSSDSSTS